MHHLCTYICVCTQMRASSGVRLRGWGVVVGVGVGLGLGLGLELVQPPGDCLRHAKGAPDGDPRDGPLVSWKPNAEGLAGRAEAPQVCSGSRCPGHPPPGGVGVREPKSWDVGAGAKGEGRQRAYSTRYSQAVSHPSKNQARPCLASEIRRDRARSGCYGLRRRPLPPGALRALRCASLSLWPAGQPFRLQVILLLPLSLPAFWESLSFHTRWCNEWMP